jgi:hypothetical protein
MTKAILPASARDANFNMTKRERHKALQVMAAFDVADAELRAAIKKRDIAARRLIQWADKIKPELAAYVAAGRSPLDAHGDALYGTCKSCGQLVERYLRGIDGERIGFGFVTSPHMCKGRRP